LKYNQFFCHALAGLLPHLLLHLLGNRSSAVSAVNGASGVRNTRRSSRSERRVVYVLHVFQKKSKRGIATPKKELELIRKRLKLAEQDHKQWSARGGQA
jgi:hypothetical protein